MKKTLDTISGLISSVFYDIIKLEESFLKNHKYKDVSSKEVRTIEAIGINKTKNMGYIAKTLDITVGTLTVSITNLEKKGYVIREKCINDKRVVNVILTEKGKKLFKLHKKFKENIMKTIVIDLSNQEREIFNGALNRVSQILHKQYINI
ncbi:MarR family winged helix-turn-helix transcriptional regulator [[Clostridium] colinum]|uniref:MarR family winged helix-turn-helix transcriptional regulator n=1 Tax=[Clostridium] colinum TaxID=36835 RepID=UPI0020241187|nr:transcriptional regulator [[Clostridium] colinum]